jgi:hypothetical protein
VDERDAEMTGEGLDDLLGLVLAQEAVVDEDARELVADGLVHEERRHGRVDAARERAEDSFLSDSRANELDLLLDHRRRRPGRRRIRDLVQEVLEDLLPVRRVGDLRVELDAVQAPLAVLERGDRGRGRGRGDGCTLRWRRDRVAVAHPHGLVGRQVVEELGLRRLELRLPELRGSRALDGAAEVACHQLHPVADPERRDPEREDTGVDLRGTVRVHRRRPAGEDEGSRVAPRDLVGGQPVPHELRVDPGLAHAARDQLAVLAAEVDDEHGTLLRRRLRD